MTPSSYLIFNSPFVDSDVILKVNNSSIKKIDFQHVKLWDSLMFKDGTPVNSLLKKEEIPVMYTLQISVSNIRESKNYNLYFCENGTLYENTCQKKHLNITSEYNFISQLGLVNRYHFLRRVSLAISLIGVAICADSLIRLAKIYLLNGEAVLPGTISWRVFVLFSAVTGAASYARSQFQKQYQERANKIWQRMVDIAVKLNQKDSSDIQLPADGESFEFVNKA